MTDLELVSTDDLIGELAKRFNAIVFVGRRENEKGRQTNGVQSMAIGDSCVCLGLLVFARDAILSDAITDL